MTEDMMKAANGFFYTVASVALLLAAIAGYAVAPKGFSREDIASARRAAGDSATAAVSTKYLNEMVKPLEDSLRFYQAKPEAAAEIVVERDTVRIISKAVFKPDTLSPVARTGYVAFEWEWHNGIGVLDTLFITPVPVYGTRFLTKKVIAVKPDTLLVALLNLPDGTKRFSAIATRLGYTKVSVTDAAIRARARSFIDRTATLAGTGACAATAYQLAKDAGNVLTIGASGVLCAGHIVREWRRK